MWDTPEKSVKMKTGNLPADSASESNWWLMRAFYAIDINSLCSLWRESEDSTILLCRFVLLIGKQQHRPSFEHVNFLWLCQNIFCFGNVELAH